MEKFNPPSSMETEPFVLDPQRLTEEDIQLLDKLKNEHPSFEQLLQRKPRVTLTPAEHFLIGSTAAGLSGYSHMPQICLVYPQSVAEIGLINEKRREMAFTLTGTPATQFLRCYSFTQDVQLAQPVVLENVESVSFRLGDFDGQTVAPMQITKLVLHDGTVYDQSALAAYTFEPKQFADIVSQDYEKKITRYTELNEGEEKIQTALHTLQQAYKIFSQHSFKP